MKRIVLTSVAVLFALSIIAQERGFVAQRRIAKDHIALIIGNSSYPDMPLTNPMNDANAVSETFKELGFVVEKVLDADRETMALAIQQFAKKMATARAAVFYFSGHGMQIDGQNYLIPIGKTEATQITTEDQVPYRAINANEILRTMESQQVNFAMVVLDACRNNPIAGTGKGKLKGLASVDAPAGSLVMYATKAGDIAYDGSGTKNSPFTTAFLQHITTPGLDVNILPSRITNTVMELTDGKQTPGTYLQLTQSFTFVPELTAEELEEIRNKQSGELTDLQRKQAEIDRQKRQEEEEMKRKQTEIDELQKQIDNMKNKTVSGGSADDLDKMLAVIEQRKKQQAELDDMKKRAEEQRLKREKELEELKRQENKAKQDAFKIKIEKYNKIANSEFGQDMKKSAWNLILKDYGLAENSIAEGDIAALTDKIGIEFSDGSFQMIRVKGGTFQMGSNDGESDEKPIHTVALSDYYIGKFEVTQKQWQEVMGSNPSNFKNCDDCPVEQVSWNDIQEFIKKLNTQTGLRYRLPTEAEWEYAARGGQNAEVRTQKWAGADKENQLGDYAWYSSNSGSKTHPVGQKKSNPLGIYDMSGNVWEWCSDWYGAYSSGSQTNPQGASSGSSRVLRGGSWGGNATYARCASRGYDAPSDRGIYIGFRLVRDM